MAVMPALASVLAPVWWRSARRIPRIPNERRRLRRDRRVDGSRRLFGEQQYGGQPGDSRIAVPNAMPEGERAHAALAKTARVRGGGALIDRLRHSRVPDAKTLGTAHHGQAQPEGAQ